jgi:hypothetical protein
LEEDAVVDAHVPDIGFELLLKALSVTVSADPAHLSPLACGRAKQLRAVECNATAWGFKMYYLSQYLQIDAFTHCS